MWAGFLTEGPRWRVVESLLLEEEWLVRVVRTIWRRLAEKLWLSIEGSLVPAVRMQTAAMFAQVTSCL